ncbi:dipeptide ABC transporter ATP-binding protein [Pseudochelatococcus sp. B33]
MPGYSDRLLDVQDLSVGYGDATSATRVLRNVSFGVNRSEIVAVVGESGSGKSTLASAILGFLSPSTTVTTGKIVYDGIDVLAAAPRELRRLRGLEIGYVPQDPGASLDPVKTIGSQIEEIFRIHRAERPLSSAEIRKRSLELLELVGINRPEVRYRQYPHELSGGMKQRVLVAIALGLRPRLIIADEPTSALDVTVQRQVLDLLDGLVKEFATSVLFITHDLALASERADRFVVLRDGRIVEDGPARAVLEKPGDLYTVRLIADAEGSAAPRRTGDGGAGKRDVVLEAVDLVRDFNLPGVKELHRAVDHVSFALRAESTLALVGESGSGKSTTARILLGLVEATQGAVAVDGEKVDYHRRSERRALWRKLQFVYQNPDSALDPRHTVAHIVGEPLASFGIGNRSSRRERVAHLIEQVGLPADVLGRRPAQLSGGQRQRVAIARALAVSPRIVVLDEPLSALDVLTQSQILRLLIDLQRELGLAYLFISHDLGIVRQFSDTVLVMKQGQIVEEGRTADVFAAPRHPYTIALLDAVPSLQFRRADETAAALSATG